MSVRRMSLVCALSAAVMLVSGCSSDDGAAGGSSATSVGVVSSAPGSAESESLPVNARGAVEVKMGEPVTLNDDQGNLVLTVTNTRLETGSCKPFAPAPENVTPALFAATIQIGDRTAPEWLWSSDMYYVDAGGKVVQNLAMVNAGGAGETWCSGTTDFVDVPPNSSADGAVEVVIPKLATRIGYHTSLLGDVDQRIEWELPPR